METPQATHAQILTITNGDLAIAAYQARPINPGNYPAVIVIQEVFGVNDYIRSVCDQIASWGYVTVAPAMFQRTAPGFAVGYSDAELALGRSHKDQMTAPQIISDIQATIADLKTQTTGEIGIVGFCFGGHVAFLGATQPEIQVAALFYPSGIARLTPGGGDPSLTRLGEIQGQIYSFFGMADPIIPPDQVDEIEAAFASQGHRVFRYAAGHGFVCDRRSDYNPAAATEAWQHTRELFATLKTDQTG
jgi:carboxymethylenebutenolidase